MLLELLPEEMDRLKSNIIELCRYLGPYPNEIWEKWKSLSNYISGNYVVNIENICLF